tara:strand:- start:4030 stop:4926 length:897 start_codon:yes stop_codon:yes gene_type:complete
MNKQIKTIYICICISKKFNEIKNLINSINSLKKIPDIKISVLFNLNDQRIKKKILQKIKKKNSVIFMKGKKQKIPEARNRVLKYLRKKDFDFGCFIDDDCYFQSKWIIKHLNFLKKNKLFNIVSGPQIPKPASIFFNIISPNFKDSSRIRWCATNNVFFRSDIIKKNKINFDISLNNIGGSDQLFFSEQNKIGNKIIWNKKNPVFEIQDKKRDNLNWFIKRNLRYSSSGHYIDQKLYGIIFGLICSIIKIHFYLLLMIASILLIPLNFKFFGLRSILFLIRFFGRIGGIFGIYLKQYI